MMEDARNNTAMGENDAKGILRDLLEKANNRGSNLTDNEIREALRPTGMPKDQITALIEDMRIGGI